MYTIIYFTILLLASCHLAESQLLKKQATEHVRSIILEANMPAVKSIVCGDNVTYTLSMTDIAMTTQNMIIHAHTQWREVTLSETVTKQYGHYVSGTNVGIYQFVRDQSSEMNCYLWCEETSAQQNVSVLLFAQVLPDGAPMPGGCNMEFALENDANLQIDKSAHPQIDRVAFQYAGKGSSSCEDHSLKRLRYTLYEYVLEDLNTNESAYFDHMTQIVTWQKQNSNTAVLGRKVKHIAFDGLTSQDFASYRGQGTIYSVLVEDQSIMGSNRRQLYVPIRTYGCKDKEQCTHFSSERIVSDIALCVVGLVAMFVAFVGHRFFKTEMFLFGHLALMMALLLILARFSTLSSSVNTILACTLGVAGGGAWLALWYFKGIPLVAIVMPSFVMGFVVASLLFNFTPFGDLLVWTNPINYGLGFTVAVIVLPVALLYFTKLLNIVCCALVGTFVVIWAASVYLHGSFKHIIPNTLYTLTSKAYLQADTYSPFVVNDIILCCVWVALFFAALSVQLLRERGRPPFPPCPYEQRKRRLHERELRPSIGVHSQVENANGFSSDRYPLLGGSSSVRYPGARASSGGIYGSQLTTTGPSGDHNRVVDPL